MKFMAGHRVRRFRVQTLLGMASVIALLSAPAAALEVAGVARVVDGDTLNVGGLGIRLHGIDAPESAQRCRDGQGRDYACGEGATRRLRALADGRRVTCEGREFDQYRRFLAVCRVGAVQINRTMVSEGQAWAFVRFSNDYVAAEREARAARVGVFASANTPPWDFRSGAWSTAQARSQAPRAECVIKGNVSRSGERIYHMPWQRDYGRVRMDQGEGKRWFCDEGEALAAGWRKAVR
jgi:endonuclease YncB( thermonuclease family)